MIVENGDGVVGANSYASVFFADEYFGARGNDAWVGTIRQKEAALIKASDYIDLRWGSMAGGAQLNEEQGLVWPRCSKGLPKAIRKACAEYAVIALSQTLAPIPRVDDSGAKTIVTSKEVGPLKQSFAQVTGQTKSGIASMYREYPIPDGMMLSVIGGSALNGKVLR